MKKILLLFTFSIQSNINIEEILKSVQESASDIIVEELCNNNYNLFIKTQDGTKYYKGVIGQDEFEGLQDQCFNKKIQYTIKTFDNKKSPDYLLSALYLYVGFLAISFIFIIFFPRISNNFINKLEFILVYYESLSSYLEAYI